MHKMATNEIAGWEYHWIVGGGVTASWMVAAPAELSGVDRQPLPGGRISDKNFVVLRCMCL